MRAQLLLAASTLALQKVPLKRQGTMFIIVGLVFAAVLCLVCRKRRSSARLNSEDDWQAQWSQVSGAQTPAGGAVELHQVGVRNPMADDREKGFSDVNLGV